MIKKLKDIKTYGLIFTIASTIYIGVLSYYFFIEGRLQPYLFDSGVDSMGSLICAALFFGSMKQKGDGTKTFSLLIVLVSASFAVNETLFFTTHIPEQRNVFFIFCLISKLLDLPLIYLLYRYVRELLNFEGKLARVTNRIIIILIAVEFFVLLSNIFYPVTFSVSADGT